MARDTAAKNQLATTNAAASDAAKQRAELSGTLIPGYTSLMNEGYTPAEESAMTTAGMGGVASSFDASRMAAENRAARTRNDAGIAAEEDKMALDKGVAMGNEAAGLQTTFANERERNRLAGLAGLQQVYGTDTGLEESMYGLGPSTLNAATAARNAQPPWLSTVNALIGAGGAVGAAAVPH